MYRTFTQTHTHTHLQTRARTHARTHAHTHTHTHTHTHSHSLTHSHTHIHAYTLGYLHCEIHTGEDPDLLIVQALSAMPVTQMDQLLTRCLALSFPFSFPPCVFLHVSCFDDGVCALPAGHGSECPACVRQVGEGGALQRQ